jgi:glycosyltransferase involved in cell wall biosynthesis
LPNVGAEITSPGAEGDRNGSRRKDTVYAALLLVMKLSIIIPVYNEEKTVGEVLSRVLALNADKEIIAVDDGSTDGTAEVLAQAAAENPETVSVIKMETNRGKGVAVRAGIAAAAGDVVAIQDADLEYTPEELPGLLEPIYDGETDVVYGSRFLGARGGNVLHYLGNRVLTFFTNVLYGTKLTDMETCYKVVRTDVLKTLSLSSDRFDIEPEITARLARAGYRILEMPVSYDGRSFAAGKKIKWADGFAALWTLIKLRFIKL